MPRKSKSFDEPEPDESTDRRKAKSWYYQHTIADKRWKNNIRANDAAVPTWKTGTLETWKAEYEYVQSLPLLIEGGGGGEEETKVVHDPEVRPSRFYGEMIGAKLGMFYRDFTIPVDCVSEHADPNDGIHWYTYEGESEENSFDVPIFYINNNSLPTLLKFIRAKHKEIVDEDIANNIGSWQIEVCNKTRRFTGQYSSNFETCLEGVEDRFENYQKKYGISLFDIDSQMTCYYITINYVRNVGAAYGAAFRSYSTAKNKWWIVDAESRINCVFNAVYTAMKWKELPTILIDEKQRRTNAKAWKKEYYKEHLNNMVSYDSLREIAEREQINMTIYNNIFEKIDSFGNPDGRDVAIKLENSHAVALIPLEEVLYTYPNIREKVKPVVQKSETVESKELSPKYKEKTKDDKIVAWDIETYVKKSKNKSQQIGGDVELVVYCSGLAWMENDMEQFVQFYGDDNNLAKFVDYLCENAAKFHRYTFYAHNGGKFDLVILIRDVLSIDERIRILPEKAIEQDGSFINLEISIGPYRMKFLDSYRIFQSSLKQVTQDMGVETTKGYIDHREINSMTYVTREDEIREYHRKDCVGLLQCLHSMSQSVWDEFSLNITNCMTGASLSKRIFFTNYYGNRKIIDEKVRLFAPDDFIYRLSTEVDLFIRSGYTGGRNECHALGIVGDAYYYDVSSMYPSVGAGELPVGNPIAINVPKFAERRKNHHVENILRDYPICFLQCEVIGTEQMLNGATPLHGIQKDGKFVFPYFQSPTVLTLYSKEIVRGKKMGYSYKFIKGYAFKNRGTPLADFFHDGFDKKSAAKDAGQMGITNMWKIMINSGYGFWGYNPYNKDTIKIYPSTKGSQMWLYYLRNERLISVNSGPRYDVLRIHQEDHSEDGCVAIAAAITSLARIKLHEIITDLASKQDAEIYYMDTDSVICSVDLSANDDLVQKYRGDAKKSGKNLGGLKNEVGMENGRDMKITDLVVMGNKQYAYSYVQTKKKIDENGVEFEQKKEKWSAKMKGCKNVKDNYTIMDMHAMLAGASVQKHQDQLMCNKNDYTRDRLQNQWHHRQATITKSFRMQYDKGVIQPAEPGKTYQKITPLTI